MFSCNLPPALLAEWPGFFTCYCGNTGVERNRNKSQHRRSTLEKKILPPFQQGFEPATFQTRVRCSNHWAIPAPSLDSIRLKCFRDALIRFRLGISDINVHKNRYKASDLPTGNDCPFCPGVEENECRLCFKCSVYNDIRPDVMKNVEPY